MEGHCGAMLPALGGVKSLTALPYVAYYCYALWSPPPPSFVAVMRYFQSALLLVLASAQWTSAVSVSFEVACQQADCVTDGLDMPALLLLGPRNSQVLCRGCASRHSCGGALHG